MKRYYCCTQDGKLIQAKITHKVPIGLLWLWKKIFCRVGWHVFDEVQSDEHYIVCDACDLIIYVDRISMKYMR